MEEDNFQEVFTRLINSANRATAKAEDKLLLDEQYIPPSGLISLLKRKVIDGGAGKASMLSIGGVRMGDSRTGKFARELFSRSFSWVSSAFHVGDLKRLRSFQVTTSKGKTSCGSVTSPLFGASFVDLEPEDSDKFNLIIGFGEDVERFCSNNSIFVIKGSIGDVIEADVTK